MTTLQSLPDRSGAAATDTATLFATRDRDSIRDEAFPPAQSTSDLVPYTPATLKNPGPASDSPKSETRGKPVGCLGEFCSHRMGKSIYSTAKRSGGTGIRILIAG